MSSEIDDPDPLILAYFLHGRQIITLPYMEVEEGEIDDLNYRDTS